MADENTDEANEPERRLTQGMVKAIVVIALAMAAIIVVGVASSQSADNEADRASGLAKCFEVQGDALVDVTDELENLTEDITELNNVIFDESLMDDIKASYYQADGKLLKAIDECSKSLPAECLDAEVEGLREMRVWLHDRVGSNVTIEPERPVQFEPAPDSVDCGV